MNQTKEYLDYDKITFYDVLLYIGRNRYIFKY